jgi:hypothetical protein
MAALVFSSGCGKQEKLEAVSFYKVLNEKRAVYEKSNSLEKDFVGSVRGWVTSVTANGGGKGKGLDQNLAISNDLAKSVADISAMVGQLRQAVYDLPLHSEFTQGVRSNMIGELTRRQRLLQDFRGALQECAASFDGFRQSREYKGDSYPAGIDKLTKTLGSYHEPSDVVTEATTALSTKYGLSEKDLGT